MQKKLSISLLIIVATITILISVMVIPVHAQSPASIQAQTIAQTATPAQISLSTPTPVVPQFTNPDVYTFAQLQQGLVNDDIILTGPYDFGGFGFSIPADWVLKPGAQINLSLGVSFNSEIQNQTDVTVVGGGTLTVSLNDNLLTTISLNKVGEIEAIIDIPPAAFEAARPDGGHVLWFGLESSESCRFSGQNTMVFIHPTSYFFLPHEIVKASTNLAKFPRPLIQNSFTPDSALFVIPDEPTSGELQSAFITAAGLGKLSSNKMILSMTTVNNFKSEDAANNHLIFVGKAASLPPLTGLTLPMPVTGGQFQLSSDAPDDGLVEMVDSPWSNGPYVALVVSGNTDQGVIKAAQAVSTGVLRPNSAENYSVIEQINATSVPNLQVIDRTLEDLGYSGKTFENRGFNDETYIFNIPVGMTVSPEAYFEMIFGNSSLLDYSNSQIVVNLNNQPIGSVRMSDATAGLPTNHAKIMIPPAAVRPGDNYLRVGVYLAPVEECSPPDVRGLWVNMWPQSILHLPQVAKSVDPLAPQDLAIYPAPFTYNPELSNTAFVLEHNDLEAWRNALQISSYLGWQSSGSVTSLAAFYGDEIPVTERSKYNMLIIGRPSQLPIIQEVNNTLPVPFLIESDSLSENSNSQVIFRIPSDSPRGYVEMMQSPWNPNNAILAVLGNTGQGVQWAADALIESLLRSQLHGNFAEVFDQQIFTSNTIYSAGSTGEINAVEIPSEVDVPLGDEPAREIASPPAWIPPVIGLLIGLIIMIVVIVVFRRRPSNTSRGTAGGDKLTASNGDDPKE